jgi:hypothetical protein
MTGEGPNDMLSQYYPVNYVRTWDGSLGEAAHTPAWKYVDPNAKIATCLIGWDDREMVNQCLAYGYIINYEPYNYKGRITDIPDTVAYGQEALKLRRKLWDYIWLGKFTDVVGAKVSVTNGGTDYIYSVFENRKNGERAVVVANQSATEKLSAQVTLESGSSDFRLFKVESDGEEDSYGEIIVKPRSLVVLVEKKT